MMASSGARSSGLEEMPSRAPGSKSATPANGEIISRVQHVDEIAAGKGRGTITAN